MTAIEKKDKLKKREEIEKLKNSKRQLEEQIENINSQTVKKMKK